MIFNPDHDALGSFLPDDIPSGTSTKFSALPPSMKFTWQFGMAIDDAGKKVDLKKIISEIKNSEK